MQTIIPPRDGGTGVVQTANIADQAVTTGKIDDLAVTASKIDTMAVETLKINDLAVTAQKIANATIDATALDTKFATGAKPCRYRGAPMMNSIILLNGGVFCPTADTVDIGADVYEFRNSTTPVAGGTAGRIWVFQGANSAASRVNLINAINGVDDGGVTVTRGDGIGPNAGTNTELVFARAGTTVGTIDVLSTNRLGTALLPATIADVAASAVAVATIRTTNTGAGTDVWNAITMYGGNVEAIQSVARIQVTITTNMITAGFVEIPLTFAPLIALVTCQNYPIFTDVWAVAANVVTVTLAGGGHPALANADVIDVIAVGA